MMLLQPWHEWMSLGSHEANDGEAACSQLKPGWRSVKKGSRSPLPVWKDKTKKAIAFSSKKSGNLCQEIMYHFKVFRPLGKASCEVACCMYD